LVSRADILRRVEEPSDLGTWSYEIKLARETTGGTVLQLCLLRQAQGKPPAYVYVVAPWTDFEPQAFRYADYAAYHRQAKAAVEATTDASSTLDVYPDPNERCNILPQQKCDQQRHDGRIPTPFAHRGLALTERRSPASGQNLPCDPVVNGPKLLLRRD
jgi:hypothetical protein